MRSWLGDTSLSRGELLGIAAIFAAMFLVLAFLLPREVLVVLLAIGTMAAVYFSASILIVVNRRRLPDWMRTVPVWLTFILPLVVTGAVTVRYWASLSPVMVALVIALLAVFFYYWFVVPLALYQAVGEQRRPASTADLPPITVLVPAYDEAGYVGPCIDALLAADYPRDALEIVVIDDGSTDGTLAEARAHATDRVTVVTKENGGKHAALNYGLEYASTDLVVTIDADSIVAEDALRELLETFEAHPDAGAVAGNVKVANRGTVITDLQALEYVIGINTFRRAFDLLGLVTVVPGCLGAFRKDVLARVGGYDSDTLTEDFDVTIKLLKEGERIHHSSAEVFTEVPDTWADLYQQRIRWFRGNLQTIVKHRRVIVDGEFGLLHRVVFPYVLFSMSALPFLGIVILGFVVLALLQGSYVEVAGMFAFFTALQLLLALLAIRIDDDDLRLARYAPFSIVGYKQFLDAVLLKSVFDVFYTKDLPWTGPQRARQRDAAAREEAVVEEASTDDAADAVGE